MTKRVDAEKLIGLIFGLIGVFFVVMGVVFMAVCSDRLPQVFTAEVWLNDPPDELALPIVGVVFAAIGAFFAAMGGGFLLYARHRRLLQEELERFGVRVPATVTELRVDRTVRINGRSPLRLLVQAQHPFTGATKTLRGPRVWETTLNPGDQVEVLFDPQDEKKYTVLLSDKQG